MILGPSIKAGLARLFSWIHVAGQGNTGCEIRMRVSSFEGGDSRLLDMCRQAFAPMEHLAGIRAAAGCVDHQRWP